MKRAILRSMVLTVSIIAVMIIANVAPEKIDNLTGSNPGLRFLLIIGVLISIILIVVSSNWLAQKIKLIRRKRKNKKQNMP